MPDSEDTVDAADTRRAGGCDSATTTARRDCASCQPTATAGTARATTIRRAAPASADDPEAANPTVFFDNLFRSHLGGNEIESHLAPLHRGAHPN